MSEPSARDPVRRATLRFKQHGVGVELAALEGVFAGAAVDAGTRHLLRWLADERYAAVQSVLDLGCGYGPLGLWLAAAGPDRRVLAVDRDARAHDATAIGAEANGVADRVEVRGSLGYDDAGAERFDLVVSNLPAKVGPAALAHLLLDARFRLTDTGTVAVVVVDRLAAAVDDLLADEAVDVLATRPTKAYTAFEYRFVGDPVGASPAPGFERGVYGRGRSTFRAGPLAWEAAVAYSIAEFDTLAHATLAALEVLPQAPGGRSVVAGVGQGHLALALLAGGHGGPLLLVDRDLLALRVAAANLGERGADVEVRHRDRLVGDDLTDAGLVVVALPEREPVAVTAALLGPALAEAAPSTEVVLHGRVADVQRVLELVPRSGPGVVEVARARHAGAAAVRIRRR